MNLFPLEKNDRNFMLSFLLNLISSLIFASFFVFINQLGDNPHNVQNEFIKIFIFCDSKF